MGTLLCRSVTPSFQGLGQSACSVGTSLPAWGRACSVGTSLLAWGQACLCGDEPAAWGRVCQYGELRRAWEKTWGSRAYDQPVPDHPISQEGLSQLWPQEDLVSPRAEQMASRTCGAEKTGAGCYGCV